MDFEPGTQPDAESLGIRYQRLASERHPDKQGGSNAAMAELNAARDQALKARGYA